MSSRTAMTTQNSLPVQIKTEKKGIEVKAVIAVIVGLIAYIGAISFGGIGLLKSYHAFSWPDTKFTWLLSAINKLGKEGIWGVLVGGGMLGGGSMGFGICKLYDNAQDRQVESISCQVKPSSQLESSNPRCSEDDLKKIFNYTLDQVFAPNAIRSYTALEDTTYREYYTEYQTREYNRRTYDLMEADNYTTIIVVFPDGSLGCGSYLNCNSDLEKHKKLLRENGYKGPE